MYQIFYYLLRNGSPKHDTAELHFYIYFTRLDFDQGRKFRVIEDMMRRIVEMMVVLFMLVLVVALTSNPSLLVETSHFDCILDCYQHCKSSKDV